jgi:hypothetical protein
MARPPILRLVVTLAFGTLPVVGCGDPEPDASFASLEGETLLARNNCTACHSAGAATVDRIRPMAGPVLLGPGGIGSRKIEAGIARALREPKAGMPDLLGRVAVDQRKQAFDDLVTYLASQGGPLAEERIELQADEAARGKTLYATIGCAACHGANPASLRLVPEGQEEAMTVTSLAKYLRVPHEAWPGGPMPSMQLTEPEARAIAAFLLCGEGDSPRVERSMMPGLRVEYHEQPMGVDGIAEDDRDATRILTLPTVTLGFPHRADEFGLRIEGEIHAKAAGEYTFWLGSDDGSWLEIDGRSVVDLGGVHGFGFKPGTITLDAGWHPIGIRYFEAQGDENLALEWQGPGFARQPVPAEAFRHEARVAVTGDSASPLDPERIRRGESLYRTLGCTQCHAPTSPGAFAGAAPLVELDPSAGCLAEAPPDAAPRFPLSAAEREALRGVVARAGDLEAPLAAATKVAHAMERVGCVACHARDGRGGPTDATNALFTGDEHAELGDQARIPPKLDKAATSSAPRHSSASSRRAKKSART